MESTSRKKERNASARVKVAVEILFAVAKRSMRSIDGSSKSVAVMGRSEGAETNEKLRTRNDRSQNAAPR